MSVFTKAIQKHKKMIIVIIILFSIFMSCGTFPFVNMSTPQSFSYFFVNILIAGVSYIYVGMLQSVIFTKESLGTIFLMNIGLTALGTGLRYLLTLGGFVGAEDFTGINIITHIVFIVGISSCTCLQHLRYNPEEAALPKDFREQAEREKAKEKK